MPEARLMALVRPFYLDMMRVNAAYTGDEVLDAVATTAREVTDGEILQLLRSDWRPRVMDAWYAVTRDEPDNAEAVLQSLDSCLGAATSPPLVITALVHDAPTIVEHLRAYVERDVSNRWGGAGLAAAALERVGEPATLGVVDDRGCLSALLAVAARLRRG